MKNQAHTTLFKRAGLAFATLAAVLVLISPAAFADNGRHGDRYDNRYENRHNDRYTSRYNDGPYRYNEYRYHDYHHYNWNNAYRDHHYNYGPRPYALGHALPRYVSCKPVPHSTLRYLRPAPRGAKYVQVGRDVLLVADGSRRVLGIIRF